MPPEGTGAWLEDCQLIIQQNSHDSRRKLPFISPGLCCSHKCKASTVSIHFLLGTGHRLFAPAHWTTRPPLQPVGLMLSPLTTFVASHLCFASCHAVPTWHLPTLLFPCKFFSSFVVPSSSNPPPPLLLTPPCLIAFCELYDYVFHYNNDKNQV